MMIIIILILVLLITMMILPLSPVPRCPYRDFPRRDPLRLSVGLRIRPLINQGGLWVKSNKSWMRQGMRHLLHTCRSYAAACHSWGGWRHAVAVPYPFRGRETGCGKGYGSGYWTLWRVADPLQLKIYIYIYIGIYVGICSWGICLNHWTWFWHRRSAIRLYLHVCVRLHADRTRVARSEGGARSTSRWSIYVCVYIYIYIERERETYLYIYIYTHTYVHIYIYIYTYYKFNNNTYNNRTLLYIYIYIHTQTCMSYIRIYICMYIRICVCMCIYIYIYTHIHTHIQTYIHVQEPVWLLRRSRDTISEYTIIWFAIIYYTIS